MEQECRQPKPDEGRVITVKETKRKIAGDDSEHPCQDQAFIQRVGGKMIHLEDANFL